MSDPNESILQRGIAQLNSLQTTLTEVSSWASISPSNVPPVVEDTCDKISGVLDTFSLLKGNEDTILKHEDTIREHKATIQEQEHTIDVQSAAITNLEDQIRHLRIELENARSSTNQQAGMDSMSSIDVTALEDDEEQQVQGEASEPRPKRQRTVRDPAVMPSSAIPASTTSGSQPVHQRKMWALQLQGMGNFVGPWTDAQRALHLEKLERCCAKQPGVESVIEAIDRHAFGGFTAQPPHPRPCLFATLLRHTRGPGGADHTYENCPTCKGASDQVCCWADLNPNVQQPFHARGADGVVPKDGRTYQLRDPQTATSPHGADSRWFWQIRRSEPSS